VRAPDPTLLVVDDDPGIARTLQILIEDELECPVATAGGGVEALAVLERLPALRLVVRDLVMPGMGGVELARRARARWPRLGVILVTAYPSSGEAARALALDGVRLLGKPVDPGELMAEVERALGAAMSEPCRPQLVP
jgi:CheY-like chemotaxis protein